MINIKKSSPLYKFVKFLSKQYVFSDILIDTYGNIKVFNDVCTFVRTFLILIFIVIPIIILMTVCSLFLIGGCIYYYVSPLFDNLYSTQSISNISIVILFILSYFVLLLLQYRNNSKMNNIDYNESDKKDSMLSQISNIIDAKKNSLCVKINVIDDDDTDK